MKRILLLLVTAAIITSCQKEIDGGSGGGTTSGGDYQPVSAGSEWNYSSTSAGTYTVKSLGTDTIINGRKYYEFENASPAGSERAYMSKINGIYRQYGDFAPVGLTLEMIYLKDSATGTTWTETVSVGGFSNYHKYTVTARGIQRVVNGKNFSDVIELDYQMSVDDPLTGGVINTGGGKQYYAKNVGAIESFFTVGFFGVNVSDTTKLVSYTIR
jgi:hypothetical protein